MAIHNIPASSTFEEWRVDYNSLSVDLGDFNAGVTGSIASGSATHTTAENAVESLVVDINSILDGTHQFTGEVTFQSNVNINGDLTLDGNITIGDQTSDTLTITAGLDSNLIPDATNTYDIGSSLKGWRNLFVTTEATLASAKVSDLTSDRIVLAGVDGALEDDINFTFDGTTLNIGPTGEFTVDVASGNTQVKGTLDVDGQGTISSLNVQDLTDNHIVLSGLNGELEEDANFTFDGTTFNIGSAGEFTVDVASGNTFINGTLETNGQATLATVVVENLTSGRIVLAGTSSALEDNTNLTFNGTTLTVTGDISAQDLYASNIVYLQGTTGSTSTTTGTLIVSGGTGISENLYVGGDINATGAINASSVNVSGGESLATTGFSIAISVALG